MKSLIRIFPGLCAMVAAMALADSVNYTYDTAGRLTGMGRDATNITTFQYDVTGNLTRSARFIVADSDNDGMADAFETTYFGNLGRNGTGDFDNDGLSDLEEFFASTVPTNNASVLKMERFITNNAVQTTVSWQSVIGKTYRVQFKSGLTNVGWNDVPGDVTAAGILSTKNDTTTLGEPNRFYRVQALP